MDQSQTNPIRAARLRKRLTQKRVADKLGVTKAAVSGWECGRMEPAPRTAIALVRLLPGLKIEEIYPFRDSLHEQEHGRAAA